MVPKGFSSLPLPAIQLSLSAVLKCGQSFRWSVFTLPPSIVQDQPTHEYRLCLRDRVVCLQQSPTTLYYRAEFPDPQPSSTQLPIREAETLVWLRDYFQLDVDLSKLYDEWAASDPVFSSLQGRFKGIRMLRQDPWENLVSFICSSNNNISRITKMVTNLCKHYSPPLLSIADPLDGTKSNNYFPFPPPSVLADVAVGTTLRSLGFGYRAEFIQRTADMLVRKHGVAVSSGLEASEIWLQGLRLLDTSGAREELLKFVGVGRKVADCILLMSLDKKEVIPVDTHVYQIAVKHYGFRGTSRTKPAMTPKLYDSVNEKLLGIWGPFAGWAHSVLFTSDLKSFASYGQTKIIHTAPVLPTPSPSPSPTKRKFMVNHDAILSQEGLSLADRIKRTRRK